MIPSEPARKPYAAESFSEDRIVRYALRPFETRWCYYTAVRPIWNEPRPLLWAQCWKGNRFFVTRPSGVASPEGVPFSFTGLLGDNDALRGHAYYFPLRLRNGDRLDRKGEQTLFALLGEEPEDLPIANLSQSAREYSDAIEDQSLLSPAMNKRNLSGCTRWRLATVRHILTENRDGIRRDWPRIPCPTNEGCWRNRPNWDVAWPLCWIPKSRCPALRRATSPPSFGASAHQPRSAAARLNPNAGELAVTAGWGHAGKDGATMPGKGRIVQREYDKAERAAIAETAAACGLSVDQAMTTLGPDHLRCVSQRLGLLEEHPGQRLGIHHRRLSGHQEVAELPRARTAGPGVARSKKPAR